MAIEERVPSRIPIDVHVWRPEVKIRGAIAKKTSNRSSYDILSENNKKRKEMRRRVSVASELREGRGGEERERAEKRSFGLIHGTSFHANRTANLIKELAVPRRSSEEDLRETENKPSLTL